MLYLAGLFLGKLFRCNHTWICFISYVVLHWIYHKLASLFKILFIGRLSNVSTYYVRTLKYNKKSNKQHNKWHWMQHMTIILKKLQILNNASNWELSQSISRHFVVGCMSYVVSCYFFGKSIYRFIFNIFSCIFLIKDH